MFFRSGHEQGGATNTLLAGYINLQYGVGFFLDLKFLATGKALTFSFCDNVTITQQCSSGGIAQRSGGHLEIPALSGVRLKTLVFSITARTAAGGQKQGNQYQR
jgi:hypothetical protein